MLFYALVGVDIIPVDCDYVPGVLTAPRSQLSVSYADCGLYGSNSLFFLIDNLLLFAPRPVLSLGRLWLVLGPKSRVT